ncbi:hypothetical protein ACFQZ4_10435 [Catellatospora coxensis]
MGGHSLTNLLLGMGWRRGVPWLFAAGLLAAVVTATGWYANKPRR